MHFYSPPSLVWQVASAVQAASSPQHSAGSAPELHKIAAAEPTSHVNAPPRSTALRSLSHVLRRNPVLVDSPPCAVNMANREHIAAWSLQG